MTITSLDPTKALPSQQIGDFISINGNPARASGLGSLDLALLVSGYHRLCLVFLRFYGCHGKQLKGDSGQQHT